MYQSDCKENCEFWNADKKVCVRNLCHTKNVYEFFSPEGGITCVMIQRNPLISGIYLIDLKYCDLSKLSKENSEKRIPYFD
jgi:hypothetical protein